MNTKATLTGILLIGSVAALGAATPANVILDSWVTVGVSKDQLVQSGAAVLPANAQMARPISGSAVTLQLGSSPAFVSDPAAMAVLEMGSNALAFVRTNASGTLELVIGDGTPQVLPFAIPLDAEGRPIAPVTLSLTQRGTALTLTVSDQTQTFDVGPMAANAEIVLSTGNSQNWPITALNVTTEPQSTAASSTTDQSQPGSSDSSGTSPAPSARSSANAGAPSGTAVATASTTTGKSSTTSKKSPAFAMEIFTPPVVRHGRSAAIRTVLAQAKFQ